MRKVQTPPSRQAGFALGFVLVLMVLGAAAFFSLYAQNQWFQRLSDTRLLALQQLNAVKQQLLRYAQFQPELYLSDLPKNIRTYKESRKIPGLGYLPCPDEDGDGSVLEAETSCGNPRQTGDDRSGFVMGYLPVGFETRNLYFGGLSPRQFFYAVDERFVNGNNLYNNGETGRYAPLNPALSPAAGPDSGSPPRLADGTMPWLSLNGQEGYVALIIVPNTAQVFQDGFMQDRSDVKTATDSRVDFLDRRFDVSGQRVNGNADGDRFFFSESSDNPGVNDVIIGITLAEWQAVMQARLCAQRDRLAKVPVDEAHWLNPYGANDNPAGSDWRPWLANCP